MQTRREKRLQARDKILLKDLREAVEDLRESYELLELTPPATLEPTEEETARTTEELDAAPDYAEDYAVFLEDEGRYVIKTGPSGMEF